MSLRLKGVDGLTIADINAEVTRGARFVVFQWVVSLVYVSFRRGERCPSKAAIASIGIPRI